MTLHTTDTRPRDGRASLPPAPAGGIRARRRRHRQQVKRRRRIRFVGVLGIAAVVSMLVYVTPKATHRVIGHHHDKKAAPLPPAALVPRIVLAHRAADGSAVSVTILAPARNGKGGTIILVPTGTMTEVASLGLEPIGQSLALGGPARLVTTVENLLGVDLRDVVVLDDTQVVSLLQPYGPLPVKIPTRVEQIDPSGAVNVLYEPGMVNIAPAEVPQLLTAKGRDSALTLLARHEAFWQAFLDRLRATSPTRITVSPVLQRSLAALINGDVDIRLLPVQAVGTSGDETGDNQELYQVRPTELASFLSSTFPEEAKRIASRPRVQVLNGVGGTEVAPRVTDRLVPAGFQVTLTGNADRFDYQQTQIIFYDRTKQAAAERVRRALGAGRLVLSLNPLDVVDVTVIVGKDFTGK